MDLLVVRGLFLNLVHRPIVGLWPLSKLDFDLIEATTMSMSASDDTDSNASIEDNEDTKELSYAKLRVRISGILKGLDLKKEDLKNTTYCTRQVRKERYVTIVTHSNNQF